MDNSSSQRLCYDSDPGEMDLISVRSVVSASAFVARKATAAASSREDDRQAVAVKGGGSSSRSLMDGRGNDEDDYEAAVPLPKVS